MKIVFEVTNERSGANIWTERMCSYLHENDISCSIDYHPVFYQFIPFRFNYLLHRSQDCIQHANTWNGWAFKTDNPLVVTEHTAIHDQYLDPFKTPAQRVYHKLIKHYEARSLELADCVTCPSHYVQKFLESAFDYSESQVILNGVDTSIFLPYNHGEKKSLTDSQKTIILFVGNLTRLKGADLLPGIMDLLGDNYLLLVTSGFKKNVKISQKNIINIGTLDQKSLVDAYNSCDIFIAPTRIEGFGLSVAEAMACGKPVVATNGSSLPELVVEGKGGFLCEMDNVNDFAEKIRYLTENEQERRIMGAYNRERAQEKFERSRMVREYIAVYKSL